MVVPPTSIDFFKIIFVYVIIEFKSFLLNELTSLRGFIFALYKISLAYIFPIPAIIFWSIRAFFIFITLLLKLFCKYSIVNPLHRGSTPILDNKKCSLSSFFLNKSI
jgi:hypothetical protein